MLGWLFGKVEGQETAALLRGATKVVSSRLTLIEVRRVIRRAVAKGSSTRSLQLLSIDDRVRRNCRRLGMSVVPDREPDSPDRGRERGP